MSSRLSVADRYRRARETGRALVGGHRGNPEELPENTLASFRSAIELGVDMIECDLHLSADGELVVIHDHTLDRTTDGSGLVVQRSLADLRRLDAGGGERLPVFAEVCELARDRVGLAIELKQIPIPYPGLEEKLITCLDALGMLDQTAVISFDHRSARRVKELAPRVVVGVLEGARPIDPAGLMRSARADIYSPHYGAMDRELVDEIHAAGGGVAVWTVDDATAVAWCKACGPDSVFTNCPREIVPAFQSS
jgi:glycerophosphoryl diester phosphodiesterase